MIDTGRPFNKIARDSFISKCLLKSNDIEFDQSVHRDFLVVYGNNNAYAFWPSTGKFISWDRKFRRGIFDLIGRCLCDHQ